LLLLTTTVPDSLASINVLERNALASGYFSPFDAGLFAQQQQGPALAAIYELPQDQ